MRTPMRRANSPNGQARDRRCQREGADDGCRNRRAQPALDQVRRLVQADPRLHGKDGGRIERQQPEGGRAQRLAARERRLLDARGASAAAPVEEIAVDRPSGSNPTSSGRRTMKQPGGHEADQQDGDAHRQPPRAPALLLHGEMGDQGQRDEAHHLGQVHDRARQRPALDEPAVQGAVDADVEGAGEVHARNAEEDVERQQRLGQRQQHGRQRPSRARPRTASCGRRAGPAPGRSAATPMPP